jgi:peptidoglycan/xylan/chitin deacetylase (PgdA/CDA1 family)
MAMLRSTDDAWYTLRRATPRGRRAFAPTLHDVPDRAWFAAFLDATVDRFRYVDVETMVQRYRDGTLEGDEVLLTFDDGYRTVFDVVEPECRARGVPYVAFVLTDVVTGGPAPWTERLFWLFEHHAPSVVAPYLDLPPGPRWRVIAGAKELPLSRLLAGLEAAEASLRIDPAPARDRYLTAEQVVAIDGGGVGTIGLHTHRHALLARQPIDVQRDEIERGVAALTGLLGRAPRYFAYPNGSPLDYDDDTVALLVELGFEAAFCTTEGPVEGSRDRFRIRRVGLNPGEGGRKWFLRTALPWVGFGGWRERAFRVTSRGFGASA